MDAYLAKTQRSFWLEVEAGIGLKKGTNKSDVRDCVREKEREKNKGWKPRKRKKISIYELGKV